MASMRRAHSFARILLCALLLTGQEAAAEPEDSETAPSVESDDRITKAREEFVRGTTLSKKAEWAEALTAFESSLKLRPHPITTYNIAVCHRAMGNYLRARRTFLQAMAADASSGGKLPESLVSDSRAFIEQIDHVAVVVKVSLSPADAAIAVDGRPLERAEDSPGMPTLVAGILEPGRGRRPPSASFRLLMDPGTHLITLSREGFEDVLINRTFAPSSSTEMKLDLKRLPATLVVESSRDGAIVTVNGVDVGTTPVEVQRPAGTYDVVVKREGFETYETRVSVNPGARANLRAPLPEKKVALTQRWWFWTAVGVGVVGTAFGTYFATRPDPTRPAPDGGGLGWTLKLR